MENNEKFLTFEIDQRLFAFSALNVIEVLINKPINPIPKSADYIFGIINFRGEAVTVVDTSKKFGITEPSAAEKKIIIVIQLNSDNRPLKLGCMCNAVRRIEDVKYADLLQVPSFGTYYNPVLLKGVFYVNHELYSIIDIEKIFSTDELLLIADQNEK